MIVLALTTELPPSLTARKPFEPTVFVTVRVNAIAPGFVTGRWWTEGQGQHAHDTVKEAVEKSVPLQGVCTPEDVAGLAIFLSSRASAYVVGEVIALDGGIVVS